MKTLKDLSIGSTLFIIQKSGRLVEENQSGYKYAPDIVSQQIVTRLEKDEKFIEVNRSSYNYFLVKIPIGVLDTSIFDDDRYIYFINESERMEHVKKIVLDRIAKCQKNIIDTKRINEKEIMDLREAYFDVLNPEMASV